MAHGCDQQMQPWITIVVSLHVVVYAMLPKNCLYVCLL